MIRCQQETGLLCLPPTSGNRACATGRAIFRWQFFGASNMKQKFAYPTERDMRFVRNSGARRDEFTEEITLANSIVDGAIIVGCFLALFATIAFLA